MSLSELSERLLAVHRAFETARLPHAFGGAIAYGYCAEEPRGTRDIDVNVFVTPSRAKAVLKALPAEVAVGPDDVTRLTRDGQVRVEWGFTPIDIFLNVHDFHRQVAGDIRWVPFAGETIPILGCDALVVFKAMFNRTKDWGDIEAVVEAGTIDAPAVQRTLDGLLGADDPAAMRFASVVDERQARS
jgi:hypothetical protein